MKQATVAQYHTTVEMSTHNYDTCSIYLFYSFVGNRERCHLVDDSVLCLQTICVLHRLGGLITLCKHCAVPHSMTINSFSPDTPKACDHKRVYAVISIMFYATDLTDLDLKPAFCCNE